MDADYYKSTDYKREIQTRRNNLVKDQTLQEKIWKTKLRSLGVEFEVQKILKIDGFTMIADFFLGVPYELIIEIDGSVHEADGMKERDLRRDMVIWESFGCNVWHVTNNQAFNMKVEEIRDKLESYRTGPLKHEYRERSTDRRKR
jgi:very-short-patch-repair endonuclease